MSKRITIISGASRGIGREVAAHLARENHFVMLLARNAEEINELELAIDMAGGKALSFPIDVADEGQVNEAVAAIKRDFGRIDCLVNNAGIGLFRPFEEISSLDWDHLMEVNVKGSFLLTKAVLPVMRNAGSGHIVAITSDAARRTFPDGALYCASKHAQDAFFKTLRSEVRHDGIKVSVVMPGLVDTFFNNSEPGSPDRAHYLKPLDIAHAVSYILNAPEHVVIDEVVLHPVQQAY
ncbi:MAG: SDR family oxidoreductase [Saprospiraceae bacterium]|nr:SDR family oxidoreductase [Saprospiraceae bacterium]